MRSARHAWLGRTVLGVGLASLFSDWSHEAATTVLPAYLATLGVAAAWLGLIEGVSDGLSSLAKLGSGFYTDRLQRRKPIAVVGYVVTALATAAFALTMNAWQVLIARAVAWLGRGVRTPVRKALLAGAVTPDTYGRAFGFERMMDTIGAVIGPVTAALLLPLLHHSYGRLFALTLIPGLMAALMMGLLVQERDRRAVSRVGFGAGLRALPPRFRRLLLAVGLFGLGDFAHSMLILLATEQLAPRYGLAGAASIATVLYVLHNVLYAGCSMGAGAWGDRTAKGGLLAAGYAMATLMALMVALLPLTVAVLALVFALGGVSAAMSETLEDSFSAELVNARQHGMAFGTLATVNGIGDFGSSIIVGVLWSRIGIAAAFGYSAVLLGVGSLLVWRLTATKDAPAPSIDRP